ncbi:hypothetical protein Leryth_022242 [Lithospermum erythrorhizon]|nr:hypothetical protein Leryth_022242 [Lithospermum erythrorhizon]
MRKGSNEEPNCSWHAQHFMDEITSSLSAQIVDFYDSELFQENVQQNNSEVASNSNCCYEDHSSYPTNHSLTPEMDNYKYSSSLENVETKPTNTITSSTTITSKLNPNDNNNNMDPSNENNLSLIFDSRGEIENDICGSIDFNPCSNNYSIPPPTQQFLNQQEQFDLSSLNNHIQHATTNMVMATTSSLNHQFDNNIHDPPLVPLMAPQLPPLYEDECLSSVPSYMRNLNSSLPSCSLIDPTIGSYMSNALSIENSGILFGNGLAPPHHESDYYHHQGDGAGIFCPENMHRVFNYTNDLQAFSNENQHLMKGSSAGPLTPEISNLDDSTFKVGKLSAEERKEKIHRYLRKRNQRNFSKKIKYACRKTLADSRPRVRGRFAKNDELMEATRAALMHHDEDTDEECRQMGVVKEEEEDMVDTSGILAHLNGVNSFNCNNSINPIHSLI